MADTENAASAEAITEQDAPTGDTNEQAASEVAVVTKPAPAPEPVKDVTYYVTNNSGAPLPVKVRNAAGEEEYLHIAGRKRLPLPKGYTVDHNFSVLNKLKLGLTSSDNK